MDFEDFEDLTVMKKAQLFAVATLSDIKDAIGTPEYYIHVATFETNEGHKPNLSELKKFIAKNNPQDYDRIVSFPDVLDRLQKKKKSPEKNHDRNKVLSLPKKQYKGCLSTKLKVKDYEECLGQYDDPDQHYEKYSTMIPNNAIRNREYHKAVVLNDHARAGILKLPDNITIRDLPAGIRLYMKSHPEQYRDYMKELKAEREYLKAIERNVHSQPNRNQIYERLINETKNKH